MVNWNSFVDYYDKVSKLETEYTLNQINCLNITSDDTVLDVGCGPGRIAIPVARRSKSVTALDAFQGMVEKCNENAIEKGITNIKAMNIDWNDAVIGENIEKHDIVIASRSMGMVNPEKLNQAAKKYVALIGWVKDNSPSIGALFEGILEENGQKFSDEDDPVRNYIMGYQYAFNKIYDMGALPNVRVVKDGFKRNYSSCEEAYKDLSELQEFPAGKYQLFQSNVSKFLRPEKDGTVTYCCERWSYVLWWNVI